MPFYKRADNELQSGPSVMGPGFALSEETHAEHTYPVQGWYWFENLDAALVGMAAPVDSVPKRKALQALILTNKDELVDQILASMPGVEGKMARAEWEQSGVVERNRPLVLQMGAALGLSSDELDALFALAHSLP